MQHKIASAVRIISFTFICLFFMPRTSLSADNATNLETFLVGLAITDQLIDPAGDLTNILLFLDTLDPQTLKNDLLQLQPTWYVDFDWSTENSLANASRIINENALVRVGEYKCSSICEPCGCIPFINLWVGALGGYLKQRKIQELPGFHTNDWGLIAGVDYVVSDRLVLGVAAGYTHSDLKWDDFPNSNTVSWDNSNGRNSIHNFYIGPYAALNWCRWVFEASILKGSQRYHSDKHITFGFVDRKAKNTHYGDSIACHVGINRNYDWFFCDFEPYLTADYIYLHVNGVKEKTRFLPSLDLKVNSHNIQFFQGEIGAAISDTYQVYQAIIVPKFKVGFQNITPITGTKLTSSFAGQPGSFVVRTTEDSIYQATAGFFLNFYIREWPQLLLSVDGAWGNKRVEYCYSGEINWCF